MNDDKNRIADRRVRWHDNGRGPRVVIDIGSESVVTTADYARELRDDLTAVIDEICAKSGPGDGGPAMGDLSEQHLANLLSGYSVVTGTDDLERMIAEIRRHRAMVGRLKAWGARLDGDAHVAPFMSASIANELRSCMKEPGNG